MWNRGHLHQLRARRTCSSHLLQPKRTFSLPPPRPQIPLPPPTPTTHYWKICMPSASLGRSGETGRGGEAVGRIQPLGSSLAGRRRSLFRKLPWTGWTCSRNRLQNTLHINPFFQEPAAIARPPLPHLPALPFHSFSGNLPCCCTPLLLPNLGLGLTACHNSCQGSTSTLFFVYA